ncbi:MAG TPA: hypothetical protein PKA64_12330, partial [Myxococcota bacterium]|nr:hypothetical protein [Myxococcota bacterium]
GVVFSSRLVGPAPAVEPGDVGRDDLVWLGVLSVVGALAAVLVAWALWTAGPRGVPSFSVEQVRGVILGR